MQKFCFCYRLQHVFAEEVIFLLDKSLISESAEFTNVHRDSAKQKPFFAHPFIRSVFCVFLRWAFQNVLQNFFQPTLPRWG